MLFRSTSRKLLEDSTQRLDGEGRGLCLCVCVCIHHTSRAGVIRLPSASPREPGRSIAGHKHTHTQTHTHTHRHTDTQTHTHTHTAHSHTHTLKPSLHNIDYFICLNHMVQTPFFTTSVVFQEPSSDVIAVLVFQK